MNISPKEFFKVCDRQLSKANADNLDMEIIMLGSVQLYFEHSLNTAYLNKAMAVARAKRGMRVKAAIQFLQHFTGCKAVKGEFKKAGDQKAVTEGFDSLGSWIDWADANAAEGTAFDESKLVKREVNSLLSKAKIARENGAEKTAIRFEMAAELIKAA